MSHEKFQSCIQACLDCAVACDHCADACLQEDNVKMMARCIALDRDCAKICYLAASYMASNSAFAHQICALCAEICDACGAECEKHAQMHDHCRECAEACRKCAEECRRMVSMRA
jgi:hypothetical protein